MIYKPKTKFAKRVQHIYLLWYFIATPLWFAHVLPLKLSKYLFSLLMDISQMTIGVKEYVTCASLALLSCLLCDNHVYWGRHQPVTSLLNIMWVTVHVHLV